MTEEVKAEPVATPEKEEKKWQPPIDKSTGQVLVNPKTGKPFEEDEWKEYQIEKRAKLNTALNLLSEVFEHHCVVITSGGVVFATPDSVNDLRAMCELAADDFKLQNELIFRQGFGFGKQQPKVQFLENLKKAGK